MISTTQSAEAKPQVTLEQYRRQERELEKTCRQFEGTMFAKIWKDMMKSSRQLFDQQDKKRLYGALEDTTVEMVSEHLSESQGIGVWKVLYDSLHAQLALPPELEAERQEKLAASIEAKAGQPIRQLYRHY